MRTKTAKAITNHFLEGGTIYNYTGDITLADGTTLKYGDWLGNASYPNAMVGVKNYDWQKYRKFGTYYFDMLATENNLITMFHNLLFPFSVHNFLIRSGYSMIYQNYTTMVKNKGRFNNVRNILLFFGDDDTAESEDDYTLKNPITGVYPSGIQETVNDEYYTLYVTNNTESTVTVKEIGAYSSITGYSSDTPITANLATSEIFMLSRKVLDAPITIEAGSQAAIYFK